MANEIGTTLLNSLTNSTFDIGNMAKILAEADVAGKRAILEKNQTKLTTELDSLNYLELNLNAFQTYLTDLSSPDLFSRTSGSSSDESVVSVSTTSDAVSGTYQIEARQLAQAHTIVFDETYTSASDSISVGNFDFEVAGQSHSISVTTSNNTLEGLQTAINNGNYGVSAAIINNGGSYQLMLTSTQMGAANEITVSGTSTTDIATGGFTTTSEAQDAIMFLNGVSVANNTNTFDEVVEGVTFQLQSVDIGSPKTVTINQNTDEVKEAIVSFVDVYNQLDTILVELGSYDRNELTEEELESEKYEFYGNLAGSSLLRSVKSDIKESLLGSVEELSGNFRSLSDIGINFDREGKLELDESALDSALQNNLEDVSVLFSKGGSSDDALVNVIGGSERTLTGNYNLNITQLAERATVTGGAATLSTDEKMAADQITDATSALTIESGATFDLQVGATTQTIDLTSVVGTYTTKDDVATAIQTEIDAQFGAGVVTISYDSTQSRFEILAASGQGTVDVSAISNMKNQGFNAASYAGEQVIDLSAASASFDVSIDGSTASTVSLSAGYYTMDELAVEMTNRINANSDVLTAQGGVSISHDGSAFTVTSNRYGGLSTVDLSNFADFGNAGFSTDLSDTGQNVDGTITTDSGILNIGSYADSTDGRRIKISDFAVIGTEDAEVRGLEFEVLGGTTGARGTITFAQGFASKLQETISDFYKADTGLIEQRVTNLNEKNEQYNERTEKIDARYEKMLLKYQMQFSVLQSILSSAEQTRNMLTNTFNSNNN